MRIPKVENMYSRKGTFNRVANQYVITVYVNGDLVEAFQSYRTIIAVKRYGANPQITLDENDWNYSITTAMYRNMFLGENTADTRKKIKSGEYKLADLNK